MGEKTILLLDLRLFSLRPVEQEAEFVREQLLPLCHRFEAAISSTIPNGQYRLAWPGFIPDELRAVEAWCANPQRETDQYLHVLSLLPRLLALADFSLPIVLFSSTGQRRVIELLKPYGNVITDFEKPRFTGLQGSDLVETTEAQFRTAMAKATGLLLARLKCSRIGMTVAVHAAESTCKSTAPETRKYIELFLDESDWNNGGYFSLGGCFATYEDDRHQQFTNKADLFDNWLVEQGVRYFDNSGVGVTPNSIRTKRNDLTPFVQGYRNNQNAPAYLGLVRLRIKKDQGSTELSPLFDPDKADNRFHLALKALLELFLCESIPALSGSSHPDDVNVSIFPATRVVPIDDPRDQNQAMTKFGLKQAKTGLFFSFDRSQVYPVVADILDMHGIKRKTYRLVAVQLPYKNPPGHHVDKPTFFRCRKCSKVAEVGLRNPTPPVDVTQCKCDVPDWQPDYRALHYLADEVLSKFPDGTEDRYAELFSSEVPGEFNEMMDDHLTRTFRSSRSLDAGDLVGAIAEFEIPLHTGKKPRASKWLQRRLSAKLSSMTGEEFLRLANRLSAGFPIKGA